MLLGFGAKCGNCDHANSGACTYQHNGAELDKVLEDTEMWYATSPKGKCLCSPRSVPFYDTFFSEFARRISLLHSLEAQSNAFHHMRLNNDLTYVSELIALAQLTQAHAASSPTAHVVGSRFENCEVVKRLCSLKVDYLQEIYEHLATDIKQHHYQFPTQELYAEDDKSEDDGLEPTTTTEGEWQPSSEAVINDLAHMSVSHETGPPVASSSKLPSPKPACTRHTSKRTSKKPKSQPVLLSSDEN